MLGTPTVFGSRRTAFSSPSLFFAFVCFNIPPLVATVLLYQKLLLFIVIPSEARGHTNNFEASGTVDTWA